MKGWGAIQKPSLRAGDSLSTFKLKTQGSKQVSGGRLARVRARDQLGRGEEDTDNQPPELHPTLTALHGCRVHLPNSHLENDWLKIRSDCNSRSDFTGIELSPISERPCRPIPSATWQYQQKLLFGYAPSGIQS